MILQVGGKQDSVNLNWITAANISGQQVRIWEKAAGESSAKTVNATSTTSKVYLSEGYKDKASPLVYNDVANHKATVEGLKENTEYTYQVGANGNWSATYTFNTGTYGDNWNFLLFGDVQLYSDKAEFQNQIKSWNNTVSTAVEKYPNTAFLLSAGDQANYSAFSEHSGFISPDELRQFRTAVNMGNHDFVDPDTYEAFYNRPNREDENYWWTYNNALFVSLDTNDYMDFDDDVEFVSRIVEEQGADKDWVIVNYHHSTFSQAYHMEDAVTQYYRERMTPVFSKLDVDLVLAGHDHIYTRSYLMDGPTPVDLGREVKIGETLAKNPGEVQYVTANSASGSKYYNFFDFKTLTRNEDDATNSWTLEKSIQEKTIRTYTAVWDQNKVPDYTNVDVTPEGLTVTTYDMEKGDIVDQFTLTRAEPEGDGGSSAGSSEDGLSGGAIAGIVLGVIAAVLGAAGAAAYFNLIPGLNEAIRQFVPQF